MRYIKDGTFAGNSIEFDGMRIINPTAEQLKSAGYEEYTEPEKTEAEKLADAVKFKTAEINSYDESDAVNWFEIGGLGMWLEREKRTALMRRFEAEKAAGITTTTLWAEMTKFTMPVESAIALLNEIEIYACRCFDVTAEHKAAVAGLSTVSEVENFDYKTGYPERLKIVI